MLNQVLGTFFFFIQPALCQSNRLLLEDTSSRINLFCWDPPQRIKPTASTGCDQVAWMTENHLIWFRNGTWPLNTTSPPLFFHLCLPWTRPRLLITAMPVPSPLGLRTTLTYLAGNRNPLCSSCSCRAPVRKCLLQLSWWGWSSRGHTRLWRGRRG